MERFKFLFVSLLMTLVSVTLFSCSSDDDNDYPKDAAAAIVGNYPGTLKPKSVIRKSFLSFSNDRH